MEQEGKKPHFNLQPAMSYLPRNYMEQEGKKHHFNLQPAMSYLPCNYMEYLQSK